MFGYRYFKADSSTFVIKSAKGRINSKGKGLSFFYDTTRTSIVAVPMNLQETPFIFGLQTADYQSLRVQGQVAFRISQPERIAELLNFNLKPNGVGYVSEDPAKLCDRVVRLVQALVQSDIEKQPLRNALRATQRLVEILKQQLACDPSLAAMGVELMDVSISAITPTPETAKALEAEARELILKEADDAIYSRRKSAVEQERTVKEAELQTELSVQQKEQEIAESRLQNERAILCSEIETEKARLQAQIDAENQRTLLVESAGKNRCIDADAQAYATAAQMKAFTLLPVENLKAIALSGMAPEQMMAQAFEALAQNASKIGELNISPDLFQQLTRKAQR
jgi:regulator of protease activity HflC (stomatin/prohibitin superfamily)